MESILPVALPIVALVIVIVAICVIYHIAGRAPKPTSVEVGIPEPYKKTARVGKGTNQCKLCGEPCSDEFYIPDSGLCIACHTIALSLAKTVAEMIPEFQEKANASEDPEDRIIYLHGMLNLLYEYKVKYADNDVNFFDQDIDEQIDEVLDAISYARLPPDSEDQEK